jgi:hypothetical protein
MGLSCMGARLSSIHRNLFPFRNILLKLTNRLRGS